MCSCSLWWIIQKRLLKISTHSCDMTTKCLDFNEDCSLKLDIQSNLNFNKTKIKQKVFRKCFPIWQSLHFYIYSVFHNSIAPSFWHDNHKNWVQFMLPHNLWLILIEMKQNAKQNTKKPNIFKMLFSVEVKITPDFCS